MSFRIHLSVPHMTGKEVEHVIEAFKTGYIAPLGPMVDKFENVITNYVKMNHALAVSTGTAALHLALHAHGIQENDVVLAPTLTFIGGVSPILFRKAEPVFVDVKSYSWGIDPDLVEEAIQSLIKKNKKPKAVIAADIYGQPCDYKKLRSICDHYGLILIADCAESLGSMYENKHTGVLADSLILSFNGNKIITTSGGGMLLSNNKKIMDYSRYLSQQARENVIYYEHKEIGYNYRMSNILASIGIAQMEALDEHVKLRQKVYSRYKESLSCLDGEVEFAYEHPNMCSNQWLSVIILKKKNPMDLLNFLKAKGIEARPAWKPMHLQPVFKGYECVGGHEAESLFKKGLCLPSSSLLKDDEVQEVIDNIKEFLKA
jgi:UDP-N-acetylbacillosamine transaminase